MVKDILKDRNNLLKQLNYLCEGSNPKEIYHSDAEWWGCHPINKLTGIEAITNIWFDLLKSFSNLKRRESIFLSGNNFPDQRSQKDISGMHLFASMCHYQGTFKNDFLGIPANNKVIYLRSCEVHFLEHSKIRKSYVLFDLLNLMKQVDIWPISPSLGSDILWPHPQSNDGVKVKEYDFDEGQNSFKIVMAMHSALGKYDGINIESMKHSQYWTNDFSWYGPSGIGSSKGMEGFRKFHQIPFLRGFPDRKGASHYIRIADNNFVVTGGWPSVQATHLGEWIGMPATNKKIYMRVMDFYRIENKKIAENWVPIDIIHILYQMGFDVFKRFNK